jgi:hypothetical protein
MTAKAVKAVKTEQSKTELKTFVENVNKKDKLNGLHITFGFTKRKRK